jgi:hypothetical protein
MMALDFTAGVQSHRVMRRREARVHRLAPLPPGLSSADVLPAEPAEQSAAVVAQQEVGSNRLAASDSHLLSSQFASDNNALYPSIGADLDVVKKSFIEVSSMGYRIRILGAETGDR